MGESPARPERRPGLFGFRLDRAVVLIVCALTVGMVMGTRKWMQHQPEWAYYENYVKKPLVETSGPQKGMFGYLPGCRAVLSVFVTTQPLGYFVFAVFNAGCCLGVVRMVYKRQVDGAGEPRAGLWLALCSAVPIVFALQNNQLVAPAVYLSMLAMTMATRGKEKSAGLLFALGVLLKTLPLPMLMFALVARRWRMVVVAGLSLGLGSLLLAAWTDGWRESVDSHLRYPAQVAAQSPVLALKPETTPRSFHHNRSPGAELARLARATGVPAVAWLHPVLAVLSLAGLVVLSVRGGAAAHLFWPRLTAWLAWVACAAPFGRYYYLLFLVPAIHAAGLWVLARAGTRRNACLAVLGVLSMLMILTRSPNPSYALLSTTMLAFSMWSLHGMVRKSAADGLSPVQ